VCAAPLDTAFGKLRTSLRMPPDPPRERLRVAYYKLLYHWQFSVEADIIRVQNVTTQAGLGEQ